MDNGYFDGYRIDIKMTSDSNEWNLCDKMKESGLSVNTLPGEEFYIIGMFNHPIVSFLWMNKDNSVYKCPIDKHEERLVDIYEKLWDGPIDREVDDNIATQLKNTDVFKYLDKKKKHEATIHCGKFLLVN